MWSSTDPCGTPNVMFDIEKLFLVETYFPITQIRLKPAQHDTSDDIMQELTHKYVMINYVEYSNTALFTVYDE